MKWFLFSNQYQILANKSSMALYFGAHSKKLKFPKFASFSQTIESNKINTKSLLKKFLTKIPIH